MVEEAVVDITYKMEMFVLDVDVHIDGCGSGGNLLLTEMKMVTRRHVRRLSAQPCTWAQV